MLKLPDDSTNAIRLADWLELTAIVSGDGDSSTGDLERSLRRASSDETDADNAIELRIMAAYEEIEQRLKAAGKAYPFDIDYGTVQIKTNWKDYPAYIFCLCLSYFGSANQVPRKLFEHIARAAAKGYLQGDAVDFGFPRSNLPKSFPEAVSELCIRIGEGGGHNSLPSQSFKDDKLDIVAWKNFPDASPSKFLLFGQCASGADWEGKLRELSPDAFCRNWMREVPISPLISSVFIPHRVERDRWNWVARNAGVVFDRCRIAYWAHDAEMDFSGCIGWIAEILEDRTRLIYS